MKTLRKQFKSSFNTAMKIEYTTNETCHTASGLVVVIDVLRAFSNAAYAFSMGADSITLVSDVAEALKLKAQMPGALVIGEVDGYPPAGFDFGNSPSETVQHDLSGRRLIQRTSAGTQGVVRSVNAERLFASSFVVAGATMRAIQRLEPAKVTFVITGRYFEGEDKACAEYLEACLFGQAPDPEPYLDRVRNALELRHMPPIASPTSPATWSIVLVWMLFPSPCPSLANSAGRSCEQIFCPPKHPDSIAPGSHTHFLQAG
jgi:2-phosphosulfolactate phosphatase